MHSVETFANDASIAADYVTARVEAVRLALTNTNTAVNLRAAEAQWFVLHCLEEGFAISEQELAALWSNLYGGAFRQYFKDESDA